STGRPLRRAVIAAATTPATTNCTHGCQDGGQTTVRTSVDTRTTTSPDRVGTAVIPPAPPSRHETRARPAGGLGRPATRAGSWRTLPPVPPVAVVSHQAKGAGDVPLKPTTGAQV